MTSSLAALDEAQAITEAHAAPVEVMDRSSELKRLTQEIDAVDASDRDWGYLHYERAYHHHRNEDLEAAIADYNIAIQAYGDRDAQLYADRGLAYETLGELAAALKDYTKAIAINRNWNDGEGALALTYAWRGDVNESLENIDAALADYNTAIVLDPSLGHALFNRAYLHYDQGNLSQAIQDFTRHIQVADSVDSWTYYGRGLAYEDYEGTAQALADYSEAIALNQWGNDDPALEQQDQANAYFARAWLHHYQGNNRRAIHNYSEALKLNPNDSLTFHNRALVQEELGRFDLALADYTGAIELNENWGVIDAEEDYLGLGSALYNRGLIYERQGKTVQAQADFQAALLEEEALENRES